MRGPWDREHLSILYFNSIYMPWQLTANPEAPVLETVYSGTLSLADLQAAALENIRLMSSTGRNLLLADCRGLIGGHSIGDLYAVIDTFGAKTGGVFIKEAVLLPALPAPAENVKFWETACRNRGICVRLFSERDDALSWLLNISDK